VANYFVLKGEISLEEKSSAYAQLDYIEISKQVVLTTKETYKKKMAK